MAAPERRTSARTIALAVTLGLVGCVAAEPRPAPGAAEDVRRVIATLDDLVADYPAAVAAPVQDETRLAVLDHLLHLAEVEARYFPSSERDALTDLAEAVAARAPAADVARATLDLRARVLATHQYVLGPAAPPPNGRGAKLWRMACSACHGSTGAGDGPQGLYLVPEPKDFHEPDVMATMSPARAFSRITDGMPGTAMPQWGSFTTAERWALASYLFTFRHDADAVARGRRVQAELGLAVSFSALAERSDGDLLTELERRGLGADAATDVLAFLRVEAAFEVPADSLAQVRDLLARALIAHEERRWNAAATGFAAARRRLAPALDLLRGIDPTTAARLEGRFARLDAERAGRDLYEALAVEVRHLHRWLDRAAPQLREPDALGAIRLGLLWTAAAAIGLGLLMARRPFRRTAPPSAIGFAVGVALGAGLPPSSFAAGVAALGLVGVVTLVLAARRAVAAGVAGLAGFPIGSIARLEVGWFGGGGVMVSIAAMAVLIALIVAAGLAASSFPILRRLLVPVLAVAAAATAGRAVWLIETASGWTPADLGWRLEVLGIFPTTSAVIAAALAGSLVAGLSLRADRARTTGVSVAS